jgi:hypothetical protein
MPRDDLEDLAKRLETLERSMSQTDRDTDRKLTFATHMQAQIVTLPVVAGDDTDIDIRLDPARIGKRPLGVICVEVRNAATGEAGCLGGSVPWTYQASDPRAAYMRILNFPGLDSAQNYAITLVVLGG